MEAPARSSFSDSVPNKKGNAIISVFSRGSENNATKTWKPPALRAPVLILGIAMCWTLIATLQFFLHKSQTESGVLFAPRIGDLPLTQTFLYLYFPTILAVVFSMYWTWIDLETKRMEPYYQLSKENGALGKDSLLLHYPFDFAPFVPLKAAKNRHWPVFWASLAVVLVTLGVVPTQAGIFSVQTVTRTANMTFDVSTYHIPVAQQASNLTFRYSQSTYGIVTLNETLPPYMARNYTLAPFKVSSKDVDVAQASQGQGTWTAATIMYFLELYCKPATHTTNNSNRFYTNNASCNFTSGPTGNLTVGEKDVSSDTEALAIKEYTGQYAGYWNHQGYADYSLDRSCPRTANSTFFAAFSKNKKREQDPPNNVTAVFCTPTYYQQPVSATIDTTTKTPLNIRTLGDKQRLAPEIFNSSTFEELLNMGSLNYEVRGNNLPAKSVPRYLESIAKTNISLTNGFGGFTQSMVGLSVGVSNQPLEDYLDWRVLSKAYADAYRLIFARAMVDVLGDEFQSSKDTVGEGRVTSEAVILEPVFVYVVEGLLGVVSLAALALLYLSWVRTRKLRTNPSTIASIMSLTADSQPLLSEFGKLDCCIMEDLEHAIENRCFKIVGDGSSNGIIEVDQGHVSGSAIDQPIALDARQNTNIAEPVRPVEFRIWVAILFVTSFVALAISLGIIYMKAKANGLPLPSSDAIVRNILENYIPTAIATLIEPMWLLINRLLCMLQPLEELRDCNAKAEKSIDLDYSSLPPQLVFFKALKARHFILATVCVMVGLAKLLAIAFAGLFSQSSANMLHATNFNQPYDLKFVPINGSIGPLAGQTFGSLTFSGAYQGGNGEDQFLVAESNYTRNTPLPPWTDHAMFYQPLFADGSSNSTFGTNNTQYEAVTKAFGAELDCTELDLDDNFEAVLTMDKRADGITFSSYASANVTIPKDSGNIQCYSRDVLEVRPGPIRQTTECVEGPGALELVFQFRPRENATQEESDACTRPVVFGWVRDPQGSCPLGRGRQLTKKNSLFIQCQPRLMAGSAKIRVDASGRLVHEAEDLIVKKIEENGFEEMFSNSPINLIGQSGLYLFSAGSPGWHNDSFSNDFIHYFMYRASNSSRLLDPNKSVPTFKDVLGPLNKAYSNLFAIWLGTNKDNLLVRNEINNADAIEAWRVEPEQRLFLSTPMFIISEAILCTYAIVAILVYLRRPGQYLARLPTSVAAVIALFAASAAVQDLRDTSHLDKKGRAKHLKTIDGRYGYGSFVGPDGSVHIGIEKSPFLRVRTKSTWLEKKLPRFRNNTSEC